MRCYGVVSLGSTMQALAAPGDLDTTFGDDGRVTTAFPGSYGDAAYAVAIQPDGKIVAAGSNSNINSADFAVARYNTDGTLDDNFADSGTVTTDFFNGPDYAKAVAIQVNGKIVAGGTARAGGHDNFALVRYNPDGSLDTTFSGNGKVYTDFGVSSYLSGLAIQSDGKIVAVGSSYRDGGGTDFAVVRYNHNGSLVTSFSGDAKLIFDFGGSSANARAVAIQPDGKVEVAGEVHAKFAG